MKPGDWVVYTKPKYSLMPGQRAKAVSPAPQGEGYSYVVEKFWVVADVLPDARLRLRTRRGKEHVIRADDANLRPARLWERWFYRDRFRAVEQSVSTTPATGEQSNSDD